MIRDAMGGRFDVIIVETFDSLSRRAADITGLYDDLKFKGVRLVSVNEGEGDILSIGLRGVIGQVQREQGAQKVHRGMVGLIARGLTAGGKAYGYRRTRRSPASL